MSYIVTLKPSGKTFVIMPSQTILEAAMIAGITIPYGCANGMCGACKGRLLNGNVMLEDYQESALTEEEKSDGLILCCKALATENITIDIEED
tara:strand:- start:1460 stop:1738 length:279 start_codon:yes stop_codon:yes gene_type:complete